MRTLRLSWLFALAGAVLISACSDSKSSLNPTAPSIISSDTANAEAGAIDAGEYDTTAKGRGNGGGDNGNSGNGNGNGNSGGGNGNGNGNSGGGNGGGGGNSGPGNGGGGENRGPGNGNVTPPTNTSPNPTPPSPPAGGKVEIEGLVTAVGLASITVNGQTVLVTSETVIRHGNRRFALSDVNIGDRVHVKAVRVTSTGPGGTTALRANEIKLQNRDDDDDDDDEDDEDDEDDDDEDEDDDDEAVVWVIASDALASETGPNTGTFRLQRDASGPARELLPLTVTFTLNGTATNGTDYFRVPLTATFPAGEEKLDVVITPLIDTLTEGSETVVLTLTNVAPFRLGSPATAVIILSDALAPTPSTPIVTVSASDPTASEAGDQGVFRFFRTGPTTSPLTVTVMITGTATNGTDYSPLLTSVNFLPGATIADVTVSPLADAVIDPLETVIMTLVDVADYDLGAPLTQVATIVITGS